MEVNLARMRGKLYELPREVSYTSNERMMVENGLI